MVQNLKVFTIGQVLRGGEPLLDIVPDNDALVVHAEFSTTDIDNVFAGMTGEIRFPAFHSRTIPVMLGKIESISHDRLVDEVLINIITSATSHLIVQTFQRNIDPACGLACLPSYCVVGRTYGSEPPSRAAFELPKKNLPRTAGLTSGISPRGCRRRFGDPTRQAKWTLKGDFPATDPERCWRTSYERRRASIGVDCGRKPPIWSRDFRLSL